MRPEGGSVRLVLERGSSRCAERRLVVDAPLTHITIGSSALCDWRVHARGVRARHARFVWTGKALRIEEQHAPGAAKVDGRPVAHRFELTASARVELGQAVIRVEWSPPDAPAPALPGPRSVDADNEETRVALLPMSVPPVDPTEVPADGDEETPRLPETLEVTILAPIAEVPPNPGPARGSPSARVHARPRRGVKRAWVIAAGLGCLLTAILLGWSSSRSRVAKTALPIPVATTGSAVPAGSASPVASSPPVTLQPLVDVNADEALDAEPTRAAEHLVNGRLTAALAQYRELAARHPEEVLYGDVARLLERDLAERCAAAGGGLSCAAL